MYSPAPAPVVRARVARLASRSRTSDLIEIVVPRPTGLSSRNLPPSASTRSTSPIRPELWPSAAPPTPSSATVARTPPGLRRRSPPSSPDAGEDDGYVMAFVHNPDRGAADLVILAAQDFTADPIARVHLPARSRSACTAAGSLTTRCIPPHIGALAVAAARALPRQPGLIRSLSQTDPGPFESSDRWLAPGAPQSLGASQRAWR
jgi:retinal pigment epithelial membrane protein